MSGAGIRVKAPCRRLQTDPRPAVSEAPPTTRGQRLAVDRVSLHAGRALLDFS